MIQHIAPGYHLRRAQAEAATAALKPSPAEPPARIWHYMDRANVQEVARELHLLDLALDGLGSDGSSHPDDLPALQYQVMRIRDVVHQLVEALSPEKDAAEEPPS